MTIFFCSATRSVYKQCRFRSFDFSRIAPFSGSIQSGGCFWIDFYLGDVCGFREMAVLVSGRRHIISGGISFPERKFGNADRKGNRLFLLWEFRNEFSSGCLVIGLTLSAYAEIFCLFSWIPLIVGSVCLDFANIWILFYCCINLCIPILISWKMKYLYFAVFFLIVAIWSFVLIHRRFIMTKRAVVQIRKTISDYSHVIIINSITTLCFN